MNPGVANMTNMGIEVEPHFRYVSASTEAILASGATGHTKDSAPVVLRTVFQL